MKRATYLTAACLLGGLMVITIISGLHGPARAAAVATPAAAPLDVVINEVAWMGTAANSSDEWIELYNNTDAAVDIENWSIYGADTELCINFFDAEGFVTMTIPARGYLIYANHEDDVKDDGGTNNVDIWDATIMMNNDSPGQIILYDAPNCGSNTIDTINQTTGSWFAGDSGNRKTMERKDPTASGTDVSNWATNDPAIASNSLDASDKPITGTPKAQNSCYQPSSAETADLTIAKTGPPSVHAGSPITYTISLGNVGSIIAAGARLTDTLPAGVEFVTQASAFTFSHAGRNLLWLLGDLPAGAQHTITITGRVAGTVLLPLTNHITATTTASETITANNTASWETTIGPGGQPHVLISAVLYDGYQSGDMDEAIQLINTGDIPADLNGWELCKDMTSDIKCRPLPAAVISPTDRIWLAREAISFTASFGFPPDYELDDWLSPGLSNEGDEIILRDDMGHVADALVYEAGATTIVGWDDASGAVEPYGVGRAEGQILYRIPSETSGLPITDTDTAADWIQYTGNPTHGRRVLYPGWDLDPLFWPLTATQAATIVVGVTPDNGFDVLAQTIARAQHTISVEVYSLRHPDVITALVQKAQADVAVTVLLEGGQVGVGVNDLRWQQEMWACQEIEAAGGQCWFMIHQTGDDIFNRYDFIHTKFIVVDGEWLALGSQNFGISSMPSDDKSNGTYGSRGVVLATNAPSVVARAADVFDRDLDPAHHDDVLRWNTGDYPKYGPPDPAFVPTLVCTDHTTYTVQFPHLLTTSGEFGFEMFTAPEAALRQSDALLGLVNRAGADDVVYVEQMYEHAVWSGAPNPRLEAYINAARRGAKVRILLNGGAFGQSYIQSTNTNTVAYVGQIARAENLDMKASTGDPTMYGIHNKMVLVWLDGEGGYSHVGSINGSEGSSKVNREMALQIHSDEVYQYLARVFEFDWCASNPVYLPLVMRDYTPPDPHVEYVVISEVMYRPNDQSSGKREWVELYNPTVQAIDLSGWQLGDAAASEYGAGRYAFPAGTVLPAGGVFVVAQQAQDFQGIAGFATPHFEFLIDPNRDDPAVPNMVPIASWDGFAFGLGDAGDRVILRTPDGADVDVVVYGTAVYPGMVAHVGGVNYNVSLERRPPYYDTDDCSVDFVPRDPPTPGGVPE